MALTPVHAKVTRNGQISLPAEIRRRWGVVSVAVIDRGDYAIVRPVPDDVVGMLQGRHAGPGPSLAEIRRAERAAEAEAER